MNIINNCKWNKYKDSNDLVSSIMDPMKFSLTCLELHDDGEFTLKSPGGRLTEEHYSQQDELEDHWFSGYRICKAAGTGNTVHVRSLNFDNLDAKFSAEQQWLWKEKRIGRIEKVILYWQSIKNDNPEINALAQIVLFIATVRSETR